MSSSTSKGESYLTGKVAPNATSKLNADSAKGKINEVFVKVGDKVTKGQKLFLIATLMVKLRWKKPRLIEQNSKIKSIN